MTTAESDTELDDCVDERLLIKTFIEQVTCSANLRIKAIYSEYIAYHRIANIFVERRWEINGPVARLPEFPLTSILCESEKRLCLHNGDFAAQRYDKHQNHVPAQIKNSLFWLKLKYDIEKPEIVDTVTIDNLILKMLNLSNG